MDVKRRTLLKGITATAAVSMVASHVTLANPLQDALVSLRKSSASKIADKPITAVLGESYKNSAFTAGIQAAKPFDTVFLDSVDLTVLNRLLTQTHTHLVGMIDHANAAVLVQLSRAHNAKIHWLGQHSLQSGINSHTILRSGNTDNCHDQLVKDVSTCPALHHIREQGISPLKSLGNEKSHHPEQWSANLALALSDLKNSSPHYFPSNLTSLSQPLQGSVVTFFIETC